MVSVMAPTEAHLSWRRPCDVEGYHVERAAVEVFSEDQMMRFKKDTAPLTEPTVGAIKAIGPFTRLTNEPFGAPVTDRSLDLAKVQAARDADLVHRFRPDDLDSESKPYRFAVYAYRIRAVNALGVEGGRRHIP